MRKVCIVANTKRQADLIAEEQSLGPWRWRYIHKAEHLWGVSPGATVLVAYNWHEQPVVRMVSRDDGVIRYIKTYPITEELQLLRRIGVDIVQVAT